MIHLTPFHLESLLSQYKDGNCSAETVRLKINSIIDEQIRSEGVRVYACCSSYRKPEDALWATLQDKVGDYQSNVKGLVVNVEPIAGAPERLDRT